ncbi:hypothetical protein CYB_1366 [Synechococcus sp. JA-2-3B'a(2-13)]|nr:hypothetical protein CYB_1366 [Synechococcus sp. JA-2-3B'a(2-13)]
MGVEPTIGYVGIPSSLQYKIRLNSELLELAKEVLIP